MRLKPADEHNQQVLTSLILSCCRWKHPLPLSLTGRGSSQLHVPDFKCGTKRLWTGSVVSAYLEESLEHDVYDLVLLVDVVQLHQVFQGVQLILPFGLKQTLVWSQEVRRSHTLSPHGHWSHTHTLGSRRIQISRLESCLALCDSGSALMKAAAAASATNTVQALCMVSRGQQRGTLQKHRRQVVSVLCVTLLTSLTWWQVISR